MDKKVKAMEKMLERHDSYLKEMDEQITSEREDIRKHTHRVEMLTYMRIVGEETKTKMIKDMEASLEREFDEL